MSFEFYTAASSSPFYFISFRYCCCHSLIWVVSCFFLLFSDRGFVWNTHALATRVYLLDTHTYSGKKNNKCVFVLILVSSIVFKYYSVLCILKYQLNQSQSQWIALELLFFVCFAFKSYAYAKTCCELLFKSFVQPLSW